jgi:nitrogen fixation protein NifQ
MDSPSDIPRERQAEYLALVELLMEHADIDDQFAPGVADRIARAATRPGHLWRAMDLDNRDELSALFEAHFPTLSAGNTRDMRWKKYLYKLMCGWPGFDG